MKKFLFFLSVTLLTLVLFSCGEEKKDASVGDQSVTTVTNEAGIQKVVSLIPSVLFYNEGSLWTENADGELEWYITLTAGQTLYAYNAEEGSESEVVEVRKMKKAGKTAEDNYLKVRYDDKDFWILNDLVVPNATASLIINETVVYTNDDIEGVSSAKIPAGTIIAIHNDYEPKADADINFKKITWRKGTERSYRNVFVKNEAISDCPEDLLALRLLKKLPNLKDEVVIAETKNNLDNLKTSEYIANLIFEQNW